VSDESIRDRLKRLRRDAPMPASPAVESSSPEPTSATSPSTPSHSHEITPRRDQVFARLARRAATNEASHTTTPDAAKDPESSRAPRSPRESLVLPVRELSLEPPRDLVRDSRGTCARTLWFERDHRHGTSTLDEVLGASLETLVERARDERLRAVDLERAVFFDTETTGLSGGAGTYVFMVGLGRFVDGRFELWQGFLPHPSEEKTLLQEVADRIGAASVLVSFFGKSFDRHRLEDKMRLHGVAPPFERTIHLDLYHPLRRAYRGKFENCRLKTLERELVGVTREDDLPGSFAPAAWFDFLAKRPHRLEGVFRHNADDVLSLATLCAHLAR